MSTSNVGGGAGVVVGVREEHFRSLIENGAEVLRRLRADARTAATPVLVISADATSSRIKELTEGGADAYLTKPLDVDQFIETVDGLLAKKRD